MSELQRGDMVNASIRNARVEDVTSLHFYLSTERGRNAIRLPRDDDKVNVMRVAMPEEGEAATADMIRQAARYLRTPGATVEDQAVWLERLSAAALPLAGLLDGIAADADKHVAGWWGNAEDEITGGYPSAITDALIGGRR